MVRLMLLLLLHTLVVLGLAFPVPSQSSPLLGTFETPSVHTRPRFRYWLPDAGVDKETVAANIKESGARGAGGVEFVPFYNYGGELDGPAPQADWVTNGFGTPAFREVFRTALQAHKDAGLLMDFALGPNQGQGVPASVDDDGLQWDLVPYSIEIDTNGTFQGQIPGWGDGELIACVSARVLSQTNVSLPEINSPFLSGQDGYLRVVLDHESLTDITNQVSRDGQLSVTFPTYTDAVGHRVFAYYQKRTLHKNLVFENNATATIWDNGSYAVDHYSARGAQTVIHFWEEHILIDGIKELVKEVGHYAWEDSMELTSNTSWTPSLPKKFEDKLGYSLHRYLPVLNFGTLWPNNNVNIQQFRPGAIQSILNTPDAGASYINDFRSVLEDCYREYLQTLTNWAHNELGLEFSAQVSYNLPMDMEVNIPYVDAPECESLQFADSVDAYRQFSGPALLAGKDVVSNEMGATTAAYGYSFPQLLFSVARAVVGGVNQLVLHGQSYSGDYWETTWPGYTAFSYTTSELYSDKQPSWNHGLEDVLNFFARVQWTQRRGVPRVDVAVYNKVSATDSVNFPPIYKGDDLVNEGWSWTYLSPDNFALPEATVKNGVLGPDGPRFKALIVTSTSNMTLSGVQRIQEYANHGLPVLFTGGLPGIYDSARGNGTETALIQTALTDLASSSENVYLVDTGSAAKKLASLGLAPNIKVQTNGKWWTTWREDASSGVDYALIFCDTNASSGYITVTGPASKKIPFYLNAWTGAVSPVFTYSVTDQGLTMPVSLQGNQTMIVAFSHHSLTKGEVPNIHAIDTPSSVIGTSFDERDSWVAHVANQGSAGTGLLEPIRLSNNRTIKLPQYKQIPRPFNLTNWTLTAEHWEAPTNLSDASTIARKYNTTHQLPTLVSWTEIPVLRNVSGLGYYTTTFQWPPAELKADGAYIYFPRILHAIQVYINGHRVPALDYTDPKADISLYISNGTNEVLAVVPTTMWNYIRSILPDIRDQGRLPGLLTKGLPVPDIQDNGLVGEVRVVPYLSVRISGSWS
ncbi:uncharacterized protein DSM5745_06307 [Aspergillus mulundensis]|uniref:Secreted protein n=1 Tax=Aspergillus mulundensis TaxID=1810919 RepID=A0A3D8RQP7_9EURO|nr:Uncharacterized protein DSM5745_06307 [Aspergillus mulundensis]RDW76315.1 Uncharacterized protein DSM5745_06307 [Aspergillus mulundensis]